MDVSIPETREFTVTPGFSRRLAWAQLRASFTVSSLVVVVGVFLIMLLLGRLGDDDGPMSRAPLMGFFVFMAVAVGVIFLITWRQADRAMPVGSRYSLRQDEDSVTISLGEAASEVPYRTYRAVARQGSFVRLRLRSTRQSHLLPAELFPGDDLDRLTTAVTGSGAAAAAGPSAGFDREYTTDVGFPDRLARTMVRWQFTRPPQVVLLGLVVVVGALFLVFGLVGLLLAANGNVPVSEVVPILVTAGGILGFAALIVFSSYLLIRQNLRRLIPAGTIYELGLGTSGFRVRLPAITNDLPYSSFTSARRRGQFVMLSPRKGASSLIVLPVQLFADDELARLNGLLNAALRP